MSTEGEQRTEGAESLVRFLERIFSAEELADSAMLTEKLVGGDYDSFQNILKRLNGILTKTPIRQREIAQRETNIGMGGVAKEIMFPNVESRQKLLEEVFIHLQILIESSDPKAQNAIARTLYNAVIYLHPFPDGNGRTARALYFLASPSEKKTPGNTQEQLRSVLHKRPKGINFYHEYMNQYVYRLMLGDRGLSYEYDADGFFQASMGTQDEAQVSNYDDDYMMYLAAYDVMTEEERRSYIQKTGGDGTGLKIYRDTLPDDLVERMENHANAVRTEMSRRVLELSWNTDDWPDWLTDELQGALSL